MANHLAIATATEALRLRLNDAIRPELPGVQVAAKRPEANDGQSQSQVSVFLYRVSPNAALRNADLPTRDAEGRVVKRPTAALDLHYLLSFAGDEQQLIPQRMLGLVVASLHSRPALSRNEIEAASQGEAWLMSSNLMDEIESVKFSMSSISLDDLSKAWSIFFQVPYQLSTGYEASVVLIESELDVRRSLPVQRRGVDALPIRQPVIESVNGGQYLAGDIALEIEIVGRRLRGPAATLIRFDDGGPHPVTPERDTRIVVPTAVSAALGAGVHSVQVIHEVMIGEPRTPHRAVESNVFPFLLRPTITVDRGGTDILVNFVPPLQPNQRVRLLLSEILDPPPTDRQLRFATLDWDAAIPVPGNLLTFDASAVPAGTYLVRAQVDDAESLTTVTAAGGVVQPAPTVTLP